MTRRLVAVLLAVGAPAASTGQHGPIVAKVTTITSVNGALAFLNPVLRVNGTIDPAPGHRLQIVEIALGATPVRAELDTVRLVTTDDREYAPIAVGGSSQLLFPVDRLPPGEEVGQILATDAILSLTKNSATSVTLEAGPLATLAFLFEVPRDAAIKTLKLPDGSRLAIDRLRLPLSSGGPTSSTPGA